VFEHPLLLLLLCAGGGRGEWECLNNNVLVMGLLWCWAL